jgi:hypothetical protein
MIITTRNTSGIGTVNHTMYEELWTPPMIARKHETQTNKVAKKENTENCEGSPSS